jgi:CheY-like chemotaxis protein
MTLQINSTAENDTGGFGVGSDTCPEVKEILCVDDDESTRTVFTELLTAQGYIVSVSAGGADALAHVNSMHFDVIITDHQMAQMNGLQLVRHLRSVAYPGKIIVFSGALTPEAIKAYNALMVDAIFLKPTGLADLLALLQKQ